MRFIAKHAGGGFLLDQSHAAPPGSALQATSRWRSFGGKAVVMQRLLDEQYGLCCYSEVRSDQLELGYHIEHVQPKSSYPHRTFDYLNLAASALSSTEGVVAFKAQGTELFGGHAKQGDYDPARFVSCHQTDAPEFFAYVSDGRIVPAHGLDADGSERAKYTIELLNLNCPFLVAQRRRWWGELEEAFDEHDSRGWSIEHLAAVDLVPSGGFVSPFFSLTRQFFGVVAEVVLRQQASHMV